MFVLDCRAGQMFWSLNLVRSKSCLSWNELSFLTASSHRENLPGHFKFKEYCPQVFRNLRERFGIEDLDYQVCKVESLADNHWWYCWYWWCIQNKHEVFAGLEYINSLRSEENWPEFALGYTKTASISCKSPGTTDSQKWRMSVLKPFERRSFHWWYCTFGVNAP